MSHISMIGLGSMGSALARALQAGGVSTTVWNRTSSRMLPLIEAGATGAGSVAEAVAASPVIVVCVDNYAITRSLFEAADVLQAIPGKTIIQLSTGTPQEARDSEAWFNERPADYLDGAVMVYPSRVGKPDALLVVAGREAVYNRCRPHLSCLAGNLRYLGSKVGLAPALDFALLSRVLGMIAGTLHGVNVCASEGLGIDVFASLLASRDPAKRTAMVVHHGAYANPGATLNGWYKGLMQIQKQARDLNINHEVPDFIAGLFERAVDAGHGEEDIAALIKVLREV